MTEFELNSILDAIGMHPYEFGRLVGKSERSMRGYYSGKRPIPLLVQREARRLWAEFEGERK